MRPRRRKTWRTRRPPCASSRFANASISAWTKAAQHRDVAEVQGDGVDADQHLAPLQPRIVFLLQAKIIQAREVIQAVAFHRGISSERKRIVSRRRPGKYIDRRSAHPQ
jgi:hypothetical protein